MGYHQIFVAIDKICSNDNTALEALPLFAQQSETSIVLFHTIKQLPQFTFYPLTVFNKLEAHYKKTVESKLNYMAARRKIKCDTQIHFGSMKSAVKKYSEKKKPDLIIIRKSRKARSLLQLLPCDILFVSRK